MQVLPLFALAFHRRRWTEASRVRLTITAAASYLSLFGILLWQALRGIPIVHPDSATMTVLAIWLVLSSSTAWIVAALGNRWSPPLNLGSGL
jgi:hypothetical protein